MSNEPTVAEALDSMKAKIFRTTPVGVAVYPHLLDHDEYQLKQNGVYQCNTKLLLDPSVPEVKKFVSDIDSLVDQAFEAGKKNLKRDWEKATGNAKAKIKTAKEGLEKYSPYDDEVDEEGEPTGKLLFKMKTTVRGTDKKTGKDWKREVPIFDSSSGKIIGEDRNQLKLWGGSKIAISTQAVPFVQPGIKKAGISLRIAAVQVVEIAGAERSADQYGFGQHEGFIAESESNDSEEVVNEQSEEEEEF
tara:strand:+ start:2297 stop:3037 length:741 start_codon:yes stop_codon:yes gene_type:complete